MTASTPNVVARISSLADETRGRILLLLDGGELTVSEICQIVQLPQSTVSRHLRILTLEGWLAYRSEGTHRHYRVTDSLDSGARRLWSAVRRELSSTSVAREDKARSRSVLHARAERSRAFFSSEAGRWDHLRGELFGRRSELQLLAGLLDGSETVGDLGCGTGQLARLLAPFAGRILAVDRSPEMLELARARLDGWNHTEVRRGELESLPVDDATLDVAILSLVLHYVADPGRVLAEVWRTLRPGGRLLLLDMQRHDRVGYREDMGHVWLGFSRGELMEWLAESGFESSAIIELPADPEAGGPLLFALRAVRGRQVGRSGTGHGVTGDDITGHSGTIDPNETTTELSAIEGSA